MQHFHFALGAVGNVEAQRVVLRIQRRPVSFGFSQRAQLQNIFLQLVQQRIGAVRGKEINTRDHRRQLRGIGFVVVIFIEQADIIAPLLAPRRQQRMGMLMKLIIVHHRRHTRLALLTHPFGAQQIFIGDDIAPVVLARVMHAHKNVRPAAKHRQHFERLLWQ